MAKIILSVDNTADYRQDYMSKNGIYCIPLKRVQNGEEHIDIFNSNQEFEDFYEQIKSGALPTTSQINPDECIAHFNKIFETEKTGDIIHISLSSGLSGSCASAMAARDAVNATANGRKVYVVDSLLAAGAIQIMGDYVIANRNRADVEEVVNEITVMRDHMQGHFMVDDLFHLHRGGRVSRTKAIIGSILGVKPILTVNPEGKLGVAGKAKGAKKGLEYFMNLLKEHDVENSGYAGKDIICVRSTQSDTFQQLMEMVKNAYPNAKVREELIGTVLGAHVGSGLVAAIFVGKSRF